MLHVLTNYNTLHENHDNQIEILMLPDELGNKLLVNRDSFFKELNEYTSKIKTIADFMANDIVSLSKYIISKVIMENGELINDHYFYKLDDHIKLVVHKYDAEIFSLSSLMKYFFNENGILISSQKVITLFDLCSIADDIVKKHNYLVEDFIDNIL